MPKVIYYSGRTCANQMGVAEHARGSEMLPAHFVVAQVTGEVKSMLRLRGPFRPIRAHDHFSLFFERELRSCEESSSPRSTWRFWRTMGWAGASEVWFGAPVVVGVWRNMAAETGTIC